MSFEGQSNCLVNVPEMERASYQNRRSSKTLKAVIVPRYRQTSISGNVKVFFFDSSEKNQDFNYGFGKMRD